MGSEPHPALQSITLDEWDEIANGLLAFGVRFMWEYAGNSLITLPGGHSSDDLAQEIVLRVLDGSRKWDPDKHGDLSHYLRRQFRSLASHAFDSWSGKHEQEISDAEHQSPEERTDTLVYRSDVLFDRQASLNPEKVFLDKETLVEKSKLADLVFKAAEGDRQLEDLVLAYLGPDSPTRRDLATQLNIDPGEITNLVKRLRRRSLNALRSYKKE
jgi:RNA polymerase sigma factor (sigma-70 family)